MSKLFNKKSLIKDIIDLNNRTSNKSYSNIEISLLESDFKKFCINNNINYSQVNTIGVDTCKDLLRRYFTDEIDGNLSRQDCEYLYKLCDDPWDNSKLERHEYLAFFLHMISNKKKLKFNKILILGSGTGGEYRELQKLFPLSKYCITDISNQALKSFNAKNMGIGNFLVRSLDIFNLSNLAHFLSKNGKFDLIIASGVYRYAPNLKIKINSAKFIYKFLLKNQGIFCIAEVSQDPKYDDPFILKDREPIFDEILQTKMRINPTQFVFYYKNPLMKEVEKK